MTSQDKVRRVYPQAHIAPRQPSLPFSVMGGYSRRGYGALFLGSGKTAEEAWADAWRRIQAARRDGGK